MTVVAIISILTSIVFVSVSEVRKKARDSNQKTNLKQMQLALELYKEAYGHYPGVTSISPCVSGTINRETIHGFMDLYVSRSNLGTSCLEGYVDAGEPANKIAPFAPHIPNHKDSGKSSGCVYMYVAPPDGSDYLLMGVNCVESEIVDVGHEFQRCITHNIGPIIDPGGCTYTEETYAIFSSGASDW